MARIFGLWCCIGLVTGSPLTVRSKQDVENFKSFLEETREDNALLLADRMAANPLAKPWENSGKYQGDILLDEVQMKSMVEEYAAGRNAYIWPATRWPRDTVVYEFGAGQFNSDEQASILFAMEEISRNTCIKFRRRRRGEYNYVRLTSRADGCYANVGYWEDRGVHILNLARSGCMLHTIVVHEWLHIIGFLHMQSTHNRDEYVRVMWQNIWPGMEHNFDMYSTDVVDNLGLPYEYTSNMHYGPYGFSTNGEPTLVPLREYTGTMGQLDYVTDYDWLRVNRHYNCPGAWSQDGDERILVK